MSEKETLKMHQIGLRIKKESTLKTQPIFAYFLFFFYLQEDLEITRVV